MSADIDLTSIDADLHALREMSGDPPRGDGLDRASPALMPNAVYAATTESVIQLLDAVA